MAAVHKETMLRSESKVEADRVVAYLDRLPVKDQREMLVFIKGMLFARGIDENKETVGAVRTV